MRTIDFSPIFRSSIGYDHLAALLEATARSEQNQGGFPPYDIVLLEEDKYRITMAVAGFKQADIDITAEKDSLTVKGKQDGENGSKYLYQGIAKRGFERKFKLADYVKVSNANLEDGLLHIELQREIPEAMKPRKIEVGSGQSGNLLEGDATKAA